jgi:hypothetical protein
MRDSTHDEADFLLRLWDQGRCPFCGRTFPAAERVGSGRRSEGGFCSLSCYAGYYSLELVDRARLRLDLGKHGAV